MEDYERLEAEFGRWAGVENVVACNSGTSALHLALEALRLPKAAEVIVPDFCMIACARAVSLAGLTPVFVDCGEDLLMDVNQVAHGCYDGGNVRAIMAVHIYGRRCNMDSIGSIACIPNPIARDVLVIEDLAEAHGIRPHPNTDAACWSFYRNKVIAGAEGGAVAFRDPEHAVRARQLRSLGFTDKHDFQHIPRGHNYRMSNVHAALILDSLHRVDKNLAERRKIEAGYDALCPDEWRMPPRAVPWVYDLRIPGMTSDRQDALVARLNEYGIQARHAFKPMHTQEEFRECRRIGGDVADRMSREVIYLPCTPGQPPLEREAFEIIRNFMAPRS